MTSYRCHRCRRAWRGQQDWNATLTAGQVTAVTCPACQTPEQNAAAEVNDATLDYGLDADGRVYGVPKTGDTDRRDHT